MSQLPFLGRLSPREYASLILSFLSVAIETLLAIVVRRLPPQVVHWWTNHTRKFLDHLAPPPQPQTLEDDTAKRIQAARDFEELCAIFGYTTEEHVVLTKDGYLLGLHRLPSRRGEVRVWPGTSTGNPVVYLHHGLLMSSDAWVCATDPARCLPFVLVEAGFDVWLGNNRGNKYSQKSIHASPSEPRFWDFSLDEFAWHDIPDALEHILALTRAPALGIVGFSQGAAQAFAALSLRPQLNAKVNVVVALAPTLSPAAPTPLVSALMNAPPPLLFLLFGRRALLATAARWHAALPAALAARLAAAALAHLFTHPADIAPAQRAAASAHLYSPTSTKAAAHWLQIMRAGALALYADGGARAARLPTRTLAPPVVLLYGDGGGRADAGALLGALPPHAVACRLRGYAHLDVLWGRGVARDVFPLVLDALREHCDAGDGARSVYSDGARSSVYADNRRSSVYTDNGRSVCNDSARSVGAGGISDLFF